MGWARGAEIAEEVWDLFKKHIPKEKRKKMANKLIDLFEGHDCDAIHSDAPDLAKEADRYQNDDEDEYE